MERKPIMAGNWKMYKTESEALDFCLKIKPEICQIQNRTVIICPPTPALSKVWDVIKDCQIALGGQNMHWEEEGAFTGEVSAAMLKSVGCSYVIIGHSERRQFFCETDVTVNKKLQAALKHNLSPIVCVGETLDQREKNETFAVIKTQINGAFQGIDAKHWDNIVIAYEPVWAIGTGKTASPEQAQEVHAYIRSLLMPEVAQKTRILYGGSVKPDNVKELMAKPDIDGGLVGGASLKVESFLQLINY